MSNKPSFGQIKTVHTTIPSTIANTKYTVVFVYQNNLWEIGPLEPSNRRPVNDPNIHILPAQEGDLVGLFWNASDEIACFIVEGLHVANCNRANFEMQARQNAAVRARRIDNITPIVNENNQ